MMRTYFTRHINSVLFCKLYHLNTVSCRNMTQMKSDAGFFCKENISCCDYIFYRVSDSFQTQHLSSFSFVHNAAAYKVYIFTMCKYRNIKSLSELHSLSA